MLKNRLLRDRCGNKLGKKLDKKLVRKVGEKGYKEVPTQHKSYDGSVASHSKFHFENLRFFGGAVIDKPVDSGHMLRGSLLWHQPDFSSS